MKPEPPSKIIVDVKNQLNGMFTKTCQYLEVIKTDIDTNPEDAKKLIDSLVVIFKRNMVK